MWGSRLTTLSTNRFSPRDLIITIHSTRLFVSTMSKKERSISNEILKEAIFLSGDSLGSVSSELVRLYGSQSSSVSKEADKQEMVFRSGETIGSYASEFVRLFQSQSSSEQNHHGDLPSLQGSTLQASSLAAAGFSASPSKQYEETWEQFYVAALGPVHITAPVAPQDLDTTVCSKTESSTTTAASTSSSPPSSPKTRRRRGKIVYVNFSDNDVLCHRGGFTNSHVGNIRYRAAGDALRPTYMTTDKTGKTAVSQQLVDEVHEWGGRFLKKNSSGWFEVDSKKAREKCGQLLREDFTPEERAAKRRKYAKKRR